MAAIDAVDVAAPTAEVAPTATTARSTRGLQRRIVLAFALLMLVVQAAIYLAVSHGGSAAARSELGNELVVAARVFDRTMAHQEDQLRQRATLVASDFDFVEAAKSHDRDRIVAALSSHGSRIQADLMMLIDVDGHVLVDPLRMETEGARSPFADLLRTATDKGAVSTIAPPDGTIFQLVLVPVHGPKPIAWVAMAFLIDDVDARDLKALTGLQVSFLTRHGAGAWHVAGSTLPADARAELPTDVARLSLTRRPEPSTLTLRGVEYATLIAPQDTSGGEQVVALLQRPTVEGKREFDALCRELLWVSAVALAFAVVSSVLVARSITRPVRHLAAFARRVARGEYDGTIDIRRDDEIGDLAVALGQMRDQVTDREKRILDLAYRDALTDLPNRALFSDRLQQAIAVARRVQRPLTIIMMDLDRFKEVNDSLGHQGGDQLLVEVARRLRDVVRRRSDTVARMGGDEFAVLLPTEDARDVMSVVRKLQESLEAPIAIGGQLVDARASLGVATYPEHGDDLITLLRHADSAMYMAKRNGTGCAIYDARYSVDSRERLSLMSELRQAVERDELVAYYQPKVDLARPDSLHAEALVRWIHATRGFVPPDQFIPFAEQTGYISTITEWMLNHVLAQLRRWRADGIAMHVAVNISTRDVMNPHFPTTLATLLTRHACAAAWLTLEITETAIVDDPVQAQANIDRLHAQGCRISIDDFGTGYSSLAYLKRLRVDELKIDKSFVSGMASDPSDAVIVRSTIDLGHNMGLRVTAEGVESEVELEQLRAMGCDTAQGYLFSRPVPAAQLRAWLETSPWVARREAIAETVDA